jgi:hypothetical protein
MRFADDACTDPIMPGVASPIVAITRGDPAGGRVVVVATHRGRSRVVSNLYVLTEGVCTLRPGGGHGTFLSLGDAVPLDAFARLDARTGRE